MSTDRPKFYSPKELAVLTTVPIDIPDFPTKTGLSEEELAYHLSREKLWTVYRDECLVVVNNRDNPRFGQVGWAFGYLYGDVSVSFGDGVATRLTEEDLCLVKKADVTRETGIKVLFRQQRVELADGELVGYNEDTGEYIIDWQGSEEVIKDFGPLTRYGPSVAICFVVIDPSTLPVKSN